MIYDVFHQYLPCKVVGREVQRNGDEVKLYAPAVFYRGQVSADTTEAAIAKAKELQMSSAPMVVCRG